MCAGLIEVHLEDQESERIRLKEGVLSLPPQYTASSELAIISLYDGFTSVNFLHRTAVEFFQHSKRGQEFLTANSHSSLDPYTQYVTALLTKLSLLGFPDIPADKRALCEEGEVLKVAGFPPKDASRVGELVGAVFVEEVMKKLYLVEKYTGIAHA